MTCIAAWTNGVDTYIGGDSDFRMGNLRCSNTQSKVIQLGKTLVGGSGCLRALQWLSQLKLPKDRTKDPRAYMDDVVPHVAVHFRGVELAGFDFLWVYRHRIFAMSSLFEVTERGCFDAIGSGAPVALGVLAALQQTAGDLNGRSRVELALRITEEFDVYVRSPFTILRADDYLD